MTNSLSRLLALPFALVLILAFTMGELELAGLTTYAILISLIGLALIYVFNRQINTWWWKRRLPKLDKTLKAWIVRYSKFYGTLRGDEMELFERRVAAFNLIKNFTLESRAEL